MEDRRIIFEGIPNTRDLGGLVSADGRVIRRGALIRSANLSQATPEDIRRLREEFHLSLIFDLRTPMARNMKPDVMVEEAGYYPFPVFADTLIGITHENDRDYARRKVMMPDMGKLYRSMIQLPFCQQKFSRILQLIMRHDPQEGAVLWHCSEGKDRAGLVAMMLLLALNVSWEDILEDYLITNETNAAKAEEYYRKVLENGGSEEVARSVRSSFVAKEEYLAGAYEEIRSGGRTPERYLTEDMNIPRGMLMEFREKMYGDV